MRIQHNIPAMNAYRNFKTNNSGLSKNLEKLSSGFKINRAGDDAAGLAISEKMRAQITGLDVAQKNAKDGISLVQTAEGALTEVHDMLNRMVTLAEQSANGTYADNLDREQLQKEVDQLRSEINRIADSSNFNGIKLLDGSLEQEAGSMTNISVSDLGAIAGNDETAKAQKGIYSVDLSQVSFLGTSTGGTVNVTLSVGGVTIATCVLTDNDGSKFKVSDLNENIVDEVQIDEITYSVKLDKNTGILTLSAQTAPTTVTDMNSKMNVEINTDTPSKISVNNGQALSVKVEQEAVVAGAKKYAQACITLGADKYGGKIKDGLQIKIGDTTYTFGVGKDSKYTNAANFVDMTDYKTTDDKDTLARVASQRLSSVASNNKQFIVTSLTSTGVVHLTERAGGIDYNEHNLTKTSGTDGSTAWRGLVQYSSGPSSVGGLTLQIGDTADSFNKLNVSISDMHTKSLGINNVDISTQDGAAAALDKIKSAINTVSDVRGTLGATQNRLDHTINNLSVMTENITDAESTIRDTDVAEEMMKYTSNNILNQAAQAMLAQANQLPQGVLQLLQ